MSSEDTTKTIKAAYDYLLKALSASKVGSEKLANFRVEESGLNEKGNFKITLSYEVTGEFPFDRQREFKDFEVDSKDVVLSMKIRKV